MTDRCRQQWEALGANDPYWAVLTDPAKKGGRWDKEEFFQTGIDEIDGLLEKLSRLRIQPGSGLALDYGCGVGRLSRALAMKFRHVVGVDISEAMLSVARSENAGFPNIRFLRNDGRSLADIDDGTVDFIYSVIALQHAPRTTQQSLIREFCRVLRPGGTLVFQTPSHPDARTVHGLLHILLGNRVLNLARRLRYGRGHVMEMHTNRREEVLRLLGEKGMSVVEVERYDFSGAAFVSYRYFATRR
ncbi:MAG: methyltransferase domain-containing protein [Betaproteobacteria bacterium]|nr:methyltransferase domain-containing protein [Betaproteobacteria bacterium]